MTTFRSEDMLVGLVALGLVPWIVWTLRRGLHEGRLPILRNHVEREARPAAFRALIALYVAAALMIAYIAFDLLIGTGQAA